ncbi:MAG: serine/threonine-protein kinase [Planctomycetia bacterium]|nr:serine/threonine-protein kinase [Planctomycetia bacterium]
MLKLTTDEFLDYLRRSELVNEGQLQEILASLRAGGNADKYSDSEFVAQQLVKQGLITNWHVRQLMKKKYKGFYLRQYRILGHLGTGGMSTVYLAEHTVMQRRVAVKVLPKKRMVNSVYLERFIREAQAIASLDHPNIVRAYDVDRLDDVHYIVMEYFEGVNLRQRVEKEGPLAYEDAASYIRQAALGLVHAHHLGIVHRDIKPDNLLVNDTGIVKILDLGLALLDESTFAGPQSSINEDKILGTADYLAPEQAINSHEIDARADIYSLGGTLYFCLTGHPPFPFGTIPQRLLAHQKETPASIFIDRPDAPQDLVSICSKMMEKKPANRFASAAEVVKVMETWLIRHGMAEPSDFPANDHLKDNTVNKDIFGTPPVEKEKESVPPENEGSATSWSDEMNRFRMLPPGSNHSGVGNEAIVNLLGSGGSMVGDSSLVSSNDDFLFSRRSMTTHKEGDADFLSLAMSDMQKSTVSDSLTGPVPTTPVARTVSTLANRNVATATRDEARVVAPPVPTSNTKSAETPTSSTPWRRGWHREVPFWFWAVFVAGYVLATFLAGILFALLMNLK